jgi:outer membrane usher protein FimD/PapC
MQVELTAIAADQNKATEKAKAADNQFLDYAAKIPNAITQFHKGNMQLLIHSDASYLNEPVASKQSNWRALIFWKQPE